MFEILKIKLLARQPVAKISNKVLDTIIKREYGNRFTTVKHKLELINCDTTNGRNRLSAAIIKLSSGDLKKIDFYVEICNHDFRDVVSQAEYPRTSGLDFGEIAPKKLKNLYINDWLEYSTWLKKH